MKFETFGELACYFAHKFGSQIFHDEQRLSDQDDLSGGTSYAPNEDFVLDESIYVLGMLCGCEALYPNRLYSDLIPVLL